MAEMTTEDQIPSYQQKKFVEVDQNILSNAQNFVNRGSGWINSGKYLSGLGLEPGGQLLESLKNPDFVSSRGLGKAFSYEDLAMEALQADPNFNPEDATAIASFAQDLEKRGLKNTDRDKIYSLATSQSVQGQIDKAVNPGKYLSEDQKTANAATAQRLAEQYGQNDPDTVEFISGLLASGDSAFEVSQFLQTTPQYQERKAAEENERVKTESAAAREALNQELLKSQQEVFQRAQPSIISSYMKAGRLNSSGLTNALAQAQAELERERQGFVANAGYNDAIRAQGYGREDFVNNQAQAFNSYLRQSEPGYQQKFNVQNASNFANFQQPYNNLARQYQLSDEARQRQYQIEDYDRQQSDFNRYLSDSKKQSRESALYGLLGAGIGGGLQGWAMR